MSRSPARPKVVEPAEAGQRAAAGALAPSGEDARGGCMTTATSATSATSGTSGTSRTSGAPAISGTSGASGPQEAQGAQGAQGPATTAGAAERARATKAPKAARARTVERRSPTGWLLLVYRVPSEPTRLRATVWRRVRGLGAIYLQSAAAALPESQSNERALRALRREIIDMGGSAVLLRCQAVAGQADVVAAFQEARNDEYAEIVDRAKDFLFQVEKEHVAQHFSYAELEENEVDLAKLQSWLEKVRRRDVLGASGLGAVEEILVECERSLEAYATQVYAREPDGH